MTANKEKNFASAIIYVNDNENEIVEFITNLYNFMDETFLKFEIICVNDGSRDNSAEKIKKTAKNIGPGKITLLNMSYYHGPEQAMNAGTDLCIGDFVFEFDSCAKDYENALIKQIYDRCLDGYDIVCALPSGKRFTSDLFYKLYNNSSNNQYDIESETFRILSRRAINRIHSISSTIPYRKAVYANCGLKVDYIKYAGKAKQKSKFSKKQKQNRRTTALDIMILYTDVAYKMSLLMTGVMMLSTFAAAIYTITVFVLGHPISGYTTTMLIISGCFFGVFAILAIILKYLSLIVNLVFKKQHYLVESIEKIT